MGVHTVCEGVLGGCQGVAQCCMAAVGCGCMAVQNAMGPGDAGPICGMHQQSTL